MADASYPESFNLHTIDGMIIATPGQLLSESVYLKKAYEAIINENSIEIHVPAPSSTIRNIIKVFQYFTTDEEREDVKQGIEPGLPESHEAVTFVKGLSDQDLVAFVGVADFLQSKLVINVAMICIMKDTTNRITDDMRRTYSIRPR
uniref:ATP-synt_ab domain-containing protein n=1 Tax=Panagrellus redivivus TaxID=6233 RepID=A0A7E4VXI7_PANRE